MDDVLTGALTVVRDYEVSNPQLFFDTVSQVYEELDGSADFDSFKTAFTERANLEGFGDAGEEFVRYADGNGGVDVVRRLNDEGTGNLLVAYEQLAEVDAEEEADEAEADEEAEEEADDSYDEDAWNAFLAEYGTGWNGEEDTWDQFKDWFLHYADEQALTSPATTFLEYAAGESDKVAVFAQYGITIEAPAAAGAEADAEEDTEAWNAFLAEYGTGWNGEEDTWDAFKDWFLHYAGEQGLTSVATGFIEYAEGESDRIAFFAQYGITIGAATADGDDVLESVAGLFDEEAIAEALQKAEAAAVASDAVAAEHVELVSNAFADVLKEIPEAAGLSEAEIQQLIDEVAAEQL